VLRRIFGSERNDITREWRRQHKDVLNDLYTSPSVIRVFKLRRMEWVGHVERMGEKRGAYNVLMRKLQGNRPIGNSGVNGMIILKSIFEKWDRRMD
jgi:transcription termination factor Rho